MRDAHTTRHAAAAARMAAQTAAAISDAPPCLDRGERGHRAARERFRTAGFRGTTIIPRPTLGGSCVGICAGET
jgi:hypothetical protein